MNSVELWNNIWNSETAQSYRGFGEVSFPFSLGNKETAMFLYVESGKRDLIRAEGLFVEEEAGCLYHESPFESSAQGQKEEKELTEELEEIRETGIKISDHDKFIEEMQTLYDAYDRFKDAAFQDEDVLTQEMQQAVTRYVERLVALSDPLSLSCYCHYSPEFMAWCLDVYHYVQLMN